MRYTVKKSSESLKNENLNILIKGKASRKLKELSKSEKEEATRKIKENMRSLEKILENRKYVGPVICAGTRAAICTAIGYAGGYTLGMLFS